MVKTPLFPTANPPEEAKPETAQSSSISEVQIETTQLSPIPAPLETTIPQRSFSRYSTSSSKLEDIDLPALLATSAVGQITEDVSDDEAAEVVQSSPTPLTDPEHLIIKNELKELEEIRNGPM